MSQIDFVGGVYGESCLWPHWREYFGSAGRGAMSLVGHVETIALHTCLSETEVPAARAVFDQGGVELHVHPRASPVVFKYVHTLSVPDVSPRPQVLQEQLEFELSRETVVRYGMLEASPVVRARTCVYDPQSAFSPAGFRENGSTAERLAIVANAAEVRRMTREDDLVRGARALLASEMAQVVIVKQGLTGALVLTSDGGEAHVPAFKTENVWTLGSGDVFVAAFALKWALGGAEAPDAADYASRATAAFVDTRSWPIPDEAQLRSIYCEPATRSGGKVYLAGPFFNLGQRWLVDDARGHLRDLGLDVFSPVHDVGRGGIDVAAKDIAALKDADAVFALLDGADAGTLYEVGYARALGKPVYALAQSAPEEELKMPSGDGCQVYSDYVTALFQIAWR